MEEEGMEKGRLVRIGGIMAAASMLAACTGGSNGGSDTIGAGATGGAAGAAGSTGSATKSASGAVGATDTAAQRSVLGATAARPAGADTSRDTTRRRKP